jgi:S1-C subfamily serine protease
MSHAWARRVVVLLIATILLVTGFLIGTSAVSMRAGAVFHSTLNEIQAQNTPNTPVLDSERIYSDIYNRVSPSVVSINVVARVNGGGSFGDQLAQGTGTGFVIDQNGDIVTNNHVVEGATRIEVNFFDGTIARGEVVGLDPDSDLAVVKVDLPAEQLHPVTFANSDEIYIGQSTVAIGSPFGQRWTMTTGIVSARDRTIEGLAGYSIGSVIQTDAAINPGNSGGPLLDLEGRVIGVNSQIMSQSRSNSGVGFAIPSNLVQRVADQLINNGRVNYSYLGISSRQNDVDLSLIEAMNLPNNTRGVVVLGVEPNGPAEQAGLQNASDPTAIDGIQVPTHVDIITAIDGQPVTGFNALIAYLAGNTSPNQTVTLSVLRDGQTVQLPVTLGERPHVNQ